MKKFSLFSIIIGILLLMLVFSGYSLNLWNILEFLLGIALFFSIKSEHSPTISINNKTIITHNEDPNLAEEIITEVTEDLEDSDLSGFEKTISKTALNFAKNQLLANKKKKFLKRLIFGCLSGSILILDSFNIFNLSFSEIILVIISSYLVGVGISNLIFGGEKK